MTIDHDNSSFNKTLDVDVEVDKQFEQDEGNSTQKQFNKQLNWNRLDQKVFINQNQGQKTQSEAEADGEAKAEAEAETEKKKIDIDWEED